MTTSPRRLRPSTHPTGRTGRPRTVATLAVTVTATAAAALALAAPASATPTEPLPFAPDVAAAADPQVVEVLDRTNAARAQVGCAPLQLTPQMTVAADQHSGEMAATGSMTHTGTDGSSPRTRLAAVGVTPRRTAENVAYGFDAGSVVDAWLGSAGHRANILDCRLVSVGISERSGAAGPFWTQVFASA